MSVCSRWGVWSPQCLEVDRCSSVDSLEGQHHRLELDVGRNVKPAEVTEEEVTWENLDKPQLSEKKYNLSIILTSVKSSKRHIEGLSVTSICSAKTLI